MFDGKKRLSSGRCEGRKHPQQGCSLARQSLDAGRPEFSRPAPCDTEPSKTGPRRQKQVGAIAVRGPWQPQGETSIKTGALIGHPKLNVPWCLWGQHGALLKG